MRDSSMSPRLRISSAANSSLRKNADRRGSQASVARAATVGRTPLNPPKFDSSPQIADDDLGGDAVAGGHLVEEQPVPGECLTSRLHERRRQAAGEVGFEREHGLGLGAIALDDDRQRLLDVRQRLVDDLLADAALERFGADAGEELGERGPGFLCGTSPRCRRGDRSDERPTSHTRMVGQCTRSAGEWGSA